MGFGLSALALLGGCVDLHLPDFHHGVHVPHVHLGHGHTDLPFFNFADRVNILDTLSEAIAAYPEATKAGIERAMREIQEMRRQASSSIVLPPAGATLGPGGVLPGGGGKIQIP